MSRVGLFYSRQLDEELGRVLGAQAESALGRPLDGLWRFLWDSVLFAASTGASGSFSATYGARLSGVRFAAPRRVLYVCAVLAQYGAATVQNWLVRGHGRLLHLLRAIFAAADLADFLCFLSAPRGGAAQYLGAVYRLLRVRAQSAAGAAGGYTEQTRLASIDFENRQLLWNALLELLNAVALPNSRRIYMAVRRGEQRRSSGAEKSAAGSCALCAAQACNPYKLRCCGAVYCYACACKALEWRACAACARSSDLSAEPLYP
ncbi:ubiquitin-protein ligase peroxin 2 [Maudiozyma humilis]|uniref:Ubiquitin-protein ligase peroxin 2 n=1 Tax=Maudiozyma humilis TaxID=51915 RepID=A0AAV5RS43_MAUHU|nr:ubiquitin-protein ligase peroxin 2 [Kazachstania humilis]